MMKKIAKFKYTSPPRNGFGTCNLFVYTPKRGATVVFVQGLKNDKLLGPTNRIEGIAASVCKALKIKPSRLDLVQRHHDDDGWTRVTFKQIRGGKFKEPKWEPLVAADWQSLFESEIGAKLR